MIQSSNPSTSPYVLETIKLVKRYGKRTVVNEVSFNIGDGEIVGLLGRNGAGKSTSFKITTGMLTPESGTVLFQGQDVTDMPMYRRAQLGMGYLAQEPSIFKRLSTYQNLMAILETRPLTTRERKKKAESLMARFDLTKNKNQSASKLSGGERRKLEIARALICEPKLILLDEPFGGVDPVAVEDLQEEVLRLREENKIAMLITDHNVKQTLTIVDRAYVISEGQVFTSGTPHEIINNEEVKAKYTGSLFKGDEFEAV